MVSRLDDLNQVTKSLEIFLLLTPEVERATPALPLAHRLPSLLLGFRVCQQGDQANGCPVGFSPPVRSSSSPLQQMDV